MRTIVVLAVLLMGCNPESSFPPTAEDRLIWRLKAQSPAADWYNEVDCKKIKVLLFQSPTNPLASYAVLRDRQGQEVKDPKRYESTIPRPQRTGVDIRCVDNGTHFTVTLPNGLDMLVAVNGDKLEPLPGLFTTWAGPTEMRGYVQKLSDNPEPYRLFSIETGVLLPDGRDPTLRGFTMMRAEDDVRAITFGRGIFLGKHQQGETVAWSVWDHQGKRLTERTYTQVYDRLVPLFTPDAPNGRVRSFVAQTADGKADAFAIQLPYAVGYKQVATSASLADATVALERYHAEHSAEATKKHRQFEAEKAAHEKMLNDNIRWVTVNRQAGTREYWEGISFECDRFNDTAARPAICQQIEGGLAQVSQQEEAQAKAKEDAERAERMRRNAQIKAPQGPNPTSQYIHEQMLRNGYTVVK